MNLVLPRDSDDGRRTMGSMLINGVALQSLERPWIPSLTSRGGAQGISCVPTGTFRLVRHDTEAHPRSFALVNEDLDVYHLIVPAGKQGRTACLIHVANLVVELRGCIAFGMARTGDTLARSRMAIDRFYNNVPWVDDEHTLTIVGVPR